MCVRVGGCTGRLVACGSGTEANGRGQGVSGEWGSLKQQGQLKTHIYTHTYTYIMHADIHLQTDGSEQ